MSASPRTCPTCGAHLSLEQLRGTDCSYCRTAFAHHARAVEHAALVEKVMAENIASASRFMAPAYVVPPAPMHLPPMGPMHVAYAPMHLASANVAARASVQKTVFGAILAVVGVSLAIGIACVVAFAA